MSTADTVRDVVAPILDERGVDLYDLELAGGTLRVLVDRDGGVDLDALGELTRSISAGLDAVDPLPGGYTLEVSSPGLERPLRTPDHFRAAVGTKVSVKTRPGTDGDRRLDGELVDADDDAATVATADGERRVAYVDVERARTVFEWGPPPKPGSPSKGKKKAKKGSA
jgi:ribosome maturation factor RimP